MLRKLLLPVILLLLAYGFWISPDFKAISAGVAIFLFGMLSLEEGFRAFTGGVLERILRRTTNTLWKSLSFGVVSTTLMQSSSLVSVITISFLSAGMLGLSEGIGIIFGANLGTTTGAWLVAGFGLKVKISAYAMPMLVFGVIMVFQKSRAIKGAGYILAGLGFLFLGIHYMKEGFDAFKDSIDLTAYAVAGYPGLFLFCFIGIAATVIMQSSHATLVLIITALAAGQISYENALALAIGANVGTTITAIIGAMGSNAAGRRLAGAHMLFNITTGVVAIVLISQLIWAVDGTSQWLGIEATDYTLKLAVFHTLFNLLGVMLMLPLIPRMVTFLERVIVDKEKAVDSPRFIVDAAVEFPDTAVEAVRNETLHIYDNARDIILRGLGLSVEEALNPNLKLDKTLEQQRRITRLDMDDQYDRRVKRIFSAVIKFISEASFTWEESQSAQVHWLRDANRNILEAVKAAKHLQKNTIRYALSDNHSIRHEYNRLRLDLVSLFRELEQIRSEGDQATSVLGLDELKLGMQGREKKQSQRLFQMIRENRITPEMGTSLINDSGYANEIQRSLIAMATTLFVSRQKLNQGAEREISLDESEIKAVLLKTEKESSRAPEMTP